MFYKKKKKASLVIEFTLLIPMILTISLLIFSLIYTVSIQAKIERSIGKALDEISSEIYLASKINSSINSKDLINKIASPISKFLGVDIDFAGLINKEMIKVRLRAKTYKHLGIKGKIPFWLDKDIKFKIENDSHSLIVESKTNLKLPILSKFKKNLIIKQSFVQAARGIDNLLDTDSSLDDDKNGNKNSSISICEYSYSGKSKHPVYHDKECMGRRKENKKNTKAIKIDKKKFKKGSSFVYEGKTYDYCKYCKDLSENE